MNSPPSAAPDRPDFTLPDPESGDDPLALTSVDPDILFDYLTRAEQTIPNLLLALKPILHHITSDSSENTRMDSATEGQARQAIEYYYNRLDAIQFILRQTANYLRQTKASPHTLRPPEPSSIPTPFASTLPPPTRSPVPASDPIGKGPAEGETDEVDLGLYGLRMESRSLDGVLEAIGRLREERTLSEVGGKGRDLNDRRGDGMVLDGDGG